MLPALSSFIPARAFRHLIQARAIRTTVTQHSKLIMSAGAKSLGIPVNVITAGRQASGNCSQPQPGSAKPSQNSYDYTQCSSNTSQTNPQIRSAEIGLTTQTVAEVNEDAAD